MGVRLEWQARQRRWRRPLVLRSKLRRTGSSEACARLTADDFKRSVRSGNIGASIPKLRNIRCHAHRQSPLALIRTRLNPFDEYSDRRQSLRPPLNCRINDFVQSQSSLSREKSAKVGARLHLISFICASLSPRMKSGSGMKPTGPRYFSLLPPVADIAQRRKARTALAVAASGCDFDTTAYS